ncbi:hypothetical protein GTO89_16345 [Heliobacterium gestii]|uniref:Inclusion body protein n=1 Tax=Heliomicrobium gestii TaxID=2699 RepID=A0A845LGD5_HELGE|nr:hypothetical protein [Heliomicrobium gestii]MBM7868472.1 hypothetical protein [Heliomicrobium gestii]MZP44601.1 hypothetical protein [Heliomicrobium gestii]
MEVMERIMKSIDVLVIVDTQGALTSNDLHNNVYLVDTNKFFGSYQQGQPELVTNCYDTQTINWRVMSINPGNDVQINRFTGEMVNMQVCVPKKLGTVQDTFWQGIVQSRGALRRYQYSIELIFNGTKTLNFDPYINVRG